MILQDVLQTHVNLRSQGILSGPIGKFDSSVCLRCGPQAADSTLSYGAKKMNINLVYILKQEIAERFAFLFSCMLRPYGCFTPPPPQHT